MHQDARGEDVLFLLGDGDQLLVSCFCGESEEPRRVWPLRMRTSRDLFGFDARAKEECAYACYLCLGHCVVLFATLERMFVIIVSNAPVPLAIESGAGGTAVTAL
jgi:hypothetical protein